ncbi:MAG: flagellar motor protein MotB [Desulfobacterales bacterium]|jgi:chemotaxis protein MotB|nr:flagellar motor protein MotB [Desulfobacterales bacterium]
MDEEQNTPVRIVFKKKKGHGGHHGGAWKVAYADFVTAMMALFIVLWIVGQSKEVKQSISGYFKDPGVFTSGSSGGILPDAQKPMPLPPPPVEVKVEVDKRASEMEELKSEAKKISETIDQTPEFSRFRDKIQVTVTNEGLRIDLVEASEGLFFDIGKAHIKAETVKLLQVIAKAHLSPLQNRVIIEGYTDARPYATAGYSNWDLSADRANSARKVLEDGGLRKDQILEVRGFADRKLKMPDKPFDYSNRRVSILLPLINSAAEIPKPEAEVKGAVQGPADSRTDNPVYGNSDKDGPPA